MSLRPAILLVLYVSLAVAPVALAWLQGLPKRGFRDEASSALAMIAFAMLLMEFLLSGRFKSVSRSTGIDLIMRFHQLVARTLTVFILVHPFLYATPFRRALPWDPSGQLSLGLSSASFLTGLFAWLLLVALVVFGIFREQFPYRYEVWRLSHGMGAALIAVLGAHHAIDAGRYSAHGWLQAFWLVMLGLALLALLWVYALTPLLQLHHPYRVTAVERVALKTWRVAIEPVSGAGADFRAGQFFWLTLDRSPFAITEHPFSISSCPAQRPLFEFTIKEAGDFTKTIASIPVGARAYSQHRG